MLAGPFAGEDAAAGLAAFEILVPMRERTELGAARGHSRLSQNLTEAAAPGGEARFVSKVELLVQSDVVSLHVMLSARPQGMIGAADLARMKPGAILVNTSRGPPVEEATRLDRWAPRGSDVRIKTEGNG